MHGTYKGHFSYWYGYDRLKLYVIPPHNEILGTPLYTVSLTALFRV